MVSPDDSTEVTPFVRSRVSGSANVLLVASDDAPGAGTACQTLLTTASERSERVLAVEYGGPTDTWVDRLRYEAPNLRRTGIAEGESIPAHVWAFLDDLGEGETGVVYVDSVSALASDLGVEQATAVLADTAGTLRTADATGFFRIDPEVADATTYERLADYTAEYVPAEQGWQISKADPSRA